MEKMIYHGSDHIIEHTMIMEQDSTALKIQIWQKNGVLALITTVMPTNIKLHVMVFQFLI